LLAEHDGAAVLGGGTMLLPALRRGERSLRHVIDLRHSGLSGVSCGPRGLVRVGAMTTYAELARSPLSGRAAALTITARAVTGGAQLRNQATIGGSACHANPASDMPGCLVGAGARVVIQGLAGEGVVTEEEFFTGAFRTILGHAEVVTGFLVPADQARVGYYKLKLAEGSWPIATATAVLGPAGTDMAATVALGGVAAQPVRIDVSRAVTEDGVVEPTFTELIRSAVAEPWTDELAPGSYRRQVSPVVARRAVKNAIGVRP